MVQSLTSSHDVEEQVARLRVLDRVIVQSEDARRRLIDAGLSADQVSRIYPGIPLATSPGDSKDKEEEERRTVLYAGDLDARVVDRLLRLASHFRGDAHPGWRMVIACRPKADRDPIHRERLARGLETLGAGEPLERVELRGRVPDMDALYRRCALMLFVADHVRKKVDLPLTLLEGMATALPLLSIDFAPVSEIFEEAEASGLEVGRRVEEGALGDALDELLGDPERLRSLGRDARALVESRFSSTRMAADYRALYRSLED